MNSINILRNLEATTKRTEKEQILTDALNSGHYDFFRGARLAYDPFTHFHIKKTNAVAGTPDQWLQVTDEDVFTPFQLFRNLLDRLSLREITGNEARDAVEAFALQCPPEIWDWFQRILLKDLKCGITSNTINKVIKKSGIPDFAKDELSIPAFECQLAKPGEPYLECGYLLRSIKS